MSPTELKSWTFHASSTESSANSERKKKKRKRRGASPFPWNFNSRRDTCATRVTSDGADKKVASFLTAARPLGSRWNGETRAGTVISQREARARRQRTFSHHRLPRSRPTRTHAPLAARRWQWVKISPPRQACSRSNRRSVAANVRPPVERKLVALPPNIE